MPPPQPVACRSALPEGPFRAWSIARWHRSGLITDGVLVELLAELPDAAAEGTRFSPVWVRQKEQAMDEGRCFDAMFPCLMAGLISGDVFVAAEARRGSLVARK